MEGGEGRVRSREVGVGGNRGGKGREGLRWLGIYKPDGIHHVQPHLHGAVGVVISWLRQSRHTVVAISQDLDAETVVLLETSTE